MQIKKVWLAPSSDPTRLALVKAGLVVKKLLLVADKPL